MAIAVVIVIGVYVWSRSRKQRTGSYASLYADNELPSISAGKGTGNEWVDGVGPVRVRRTDNDIDEVLASIKEDARPGSKLARMRREAMLRNVAKTEPAKVDKANASPEVNIASAQEAAKSASSAATKTEDDLVALYLVAPRGEQIKGEQILSASYAVKLEHGDIHIFHRHDSDGSVMFSMASMQEPGYFDIDNMHQMKTRGITLFTQLSYCTRPVKALDEMLVAAHSLASMLGVQVCNADRKLLDENYTLGLRAKARHFADQS
ncbi:MAG TPA: cell division protein ZipA C-terminal FtsZ-binding domain-containing protein [Gammaproteobacteria bacterium]|nr:cell division protein ZipA C-terminal FtsZ-binding domain-containing protein [Gammaproteobacteria bacterium]